MTSFAARSTRLQTQLNGSPPGYFLGSQNYPTADSVLELVKLVVSLEKSVDPGVPLDTIIINNDVGFEPGNSYLKSINGAKTRTGYLYSYSRENFGRSFGGYNDAFSKFRHKYDYFIFTEDDVLLNGNNYALSALEQIESKPEVGFVAFLGVSDRGIVKGGTFRLVHAHGGVGISKTKVLDQIFQRDGSLPYSSCPSEQGIEEIIIHGEVPFTNEIAKLGYSLEPLRKELKVYEFAFDYSRGIRVKRYPSIFESCIHTVKSNLMRVANKIYKYLRLNRLFSQK